MRIFISHAVANSGLAIKLADLFEASSCHGVKTFVSSRAGDIPSHEEFFESIKENIKNADAYIVILTPESVLRPWVNFESGAAWFFSEYLNENKKLIFLRMKSLSTDEIPQPISNKQIYKLDEYDDLLAVLNNLDLSVEKLEDKFTQIIQEVSQNVQTGNNECSWEGVLINNVYYAWSGPLENLQDYDFTIAPHGLLEEIEKRGLKPRWATPEKITNHIDRVDRGMAQVFATDREKWKRLIKDRRRILIVGNPKKE